MLIGACSCAYASRAPYTRGKEDELASVEAAELRKLQVVVMQLLPSTSRSKQLAEYGAKPHVPHCPLGRHKS
jgi:hypothetical protein